MLKYYKNFILCGEIDFFCLLCNESFESTEELEKHIRWEKHRQKIKLFNAVPQGKETIAKIAKDCYYCYMCNIVTPSVSTMNEHTKENKCKANLQIVENSKNNEKKVIVKRDIDFVRVSNYAVTKREWHGVVNNQCLFCKTPANDKHTALPSHLVKFVKAELKTDENGWIYRKINPNIFYCFKCKKTVAEDSLADHPNSEEHSPNSQLDKNATKQRPLFEIDRENSLATCTLCNKVVFWSILPMSDHKNEHVKKNEWKTTDTNKDIEFLALVHQDKGKLRSDLKKYGKDNFIKLNQGGGKGYCTLCNTYISAHIRNFRQHVNGIRHINHLELKGIIKKTKKSEKLRYKTKTIQQLFNDQELFFLKDRNIFFYKDLSINMFNFLLMSSPEVHGGKVVCYLCDQVNDKLEDHLATSHRSKLLATPVITTLKNEFIREIRPGVYHCGICNIPFAGWSVMERHLNLFKHRFAKIESAKYVKEFVDSMNDENHNSNDTDDDCDCSCDRCMLSKMPDFLD